MYNHTVHYTSNALRIVNCIVYCWALLLLQSNNYFLLQEKMNPFVLQSADTVNVYVILLHNNYLQTLKFILLNRNFQMNQVVMNLNVT